MRRRSRAGSEQAKARRRKVAARKRGTAPKSTRRRSPAASVSEQVAQDEARRIAANVAKLPEVLWKSGNA
jgi:hypothetical protein